MAKMKKKAASGNSKKRAGAPSASKAKPSSAKAKKPSPSKVKKPVAPANMEQEVVKAEPVVKLPKSPFNAKEKKEYRDRLFKMRERLTGQIDFLVTDNLSRSPHDSEVDFRSEEAGTDNFERDFALNRASLGQDTIFEIDQALNRIEMDSFGVCELCEKLIEKPRLAALPQSRLCIKCKSKLEVGRNRFRSFDSQALFPAVEKTGAEAGTEEE